VALTGEVKRAHCIRRDGGLEGDALYVTGLLGGSIAGKHLDFAPRVAEAQWLAQNHPPHAMMDLSDGLAADLPRLAAASGCGFFLEKEALPRCGDCTVEQALGMERTTNSLCSLTTTLARAGSFVEKEIPRLRLTRIGQLTRRQKHQQVLARRGYDHFAPSH
jgi:thiamine-monophosphate kinase